MSRNPRCITLPLLSLIAVMSVGASPNAATCKAFYGAGANQNPDVATAAARRTAEMKAGRHGRGRIVNRRANRQLIRRSPPMWRAYYRVLFCGVDRQQPRQRIPGPTLPRPFR